MTNSLNQSSTPHLESNKLESQQIKFLDHQSSNLNRKDNIDLNNTQHPSCNKNENTHHITSIRSSTLLRAIILFTLGSLLTFVLNILQMEYKSNLFPSNVLQFLQSIWWAIPVCGLASVYIGIAYPYFDHKFGQCHHDDRDWTLIIRCISLFIGLNHLCAKIQFANSSHFLIIFIVFCLVFWYWFDNSKFGLIFNIINAVSVIIIAHILRHYEIINNYNEIQFNYLQICLLCLTFTGGISIGNIGRLLDFYDIHHSHKSYNVHLHAD